MSLDRSGEDCRNLRISAGLTMSSVGGQLGITPAAVDQIEGALQLPTALYEHFRAAVERAAAQRTSRRERAAAQRTSRRERARTAREQAQTIHSVLGEEFARFVAAIVRVPKEEIRGGGAWPSPEKTARCSGGPSS
jgi:transcriptional regulator with XRE-family HTH domain